MSGVGDQLAFTDRCDAIIDRLKKRLNSFMAWIRSEAVLAFNNPIPFTIQEEEARSIVLNDCARKNKILSAGSHLRSINGEVV